MYDSYHSYTHITTMFSYVRNMFVLVPTPLTHILQSVSNYGFNCTWTAGPRACGRVWERGLAIILNGVALTPRP